MARSLTAALLTGAALSMLWVTDAACAQVKNFDIPSDEASRTIPEFGRQAGLQIMAPSDQLGGIRTEALQGEIDTRAALRQLISGTGLVVASDDGTAITLKKAEATQEDASGPAGAKSSGAEVIVTAQRRSEPLQNVPISVTALGSEQLATAGVTNTAQLKSIVPGLNLTLTGAYLQPAIRGISTTLAEPGNDANVAIYIDGVYQPGQATNLVDLPDISRIEVLKGPQGTLFGRNATGGAIQIFTQEPSFTPTGNFSVSTGYYDVGGMQEAVKGFITGPLAGKLAGSLSAYFTNDDGYMRNTFDGERLGYQNWGARGKLLLEPTDSIKFTLGAYYLTRDDHHSQATRPLNNNTIGFALDPSLVIPSGNYNVDVDFPPRLTTRNFGFTLKSEFELAAGTLTSLTAYQSNDSFRNLTDADSSPVFVGHYVNPFQDRTFSEEVSFASRKFGPVSVVGGLFFYRDRASFQPFTVVGVVSLDGKQKTTAAAGFTEVTVDVTSKLSIIGGLRYSWERKEGFADLRPFPYTKLGEQAWYSLTPRVSARYEVGDRSNVYFTYSKGFKSGGFNTIAFDPNPVSPEKIQSYELGFKTAQSNYSISSAIFYYDYQDLQVGVLSGLVNIDENAGKARIYGLEFDGTWKPVEPLELQAGVSYLPEAKYTRYPNAAVNIPTGFGGNVTVARDASGARMIRAPRLTVSGGGTYTANFETGTLALSLNAYYTAKFPIVVLGQVTQSAYTLVNANLSWAFGTSGWRASIWGRNLTNKKDIIGTTDIGTLGDGVNYEAPRQVGISVNYTY